MIESLLHIVNMKFEFENLEIRFHKRRFCFWSSKLLCALCIRGKRLLK